VAEKERILVLSVDIDDDLGQKAKVRGPVIGKQAVLDAASKLALADPEDSDANGFFEAVRIHDQLVQQEAGAVEVAIITGSAKLGYAADHEVVNQLERAIAKFHPNACVFVSDGASDDRIIPLIQNRLKITSVKHVVVKQQKELEKTYFVILDKLKEPQFARVIFGVPGVALLLWYFFQDLGIRIFVGLLGAYLLIKGIGLEDFVLKRLTTLKFDFDKVSSVFTFAAIPIVFAALWLAGSHAAAVSAAGEANIAKLSALFLKELLLLLPYAFVLIILGRAVEAVQENKKYLIPGHVVSLSVVILLWIVFLTATDWVLGEASFSNFFYAVVLGLVAIGLVVYLAREFRRGIITRLRLEGRQAFSEAGVLGRITRVDNVKEVFHVRTPNGQIVDFSFDHIANIGEKVLVRY
jgi:putative membrane protein